MPVKKLIVIILTCSVLLLSGLLCLGVSFLNAGSSGNSDGVTSSLVLGLYLGVGESAMESRQYGFAKEAFERALQVAKGEKQNNKTDCAEALTRIGQCSRRLSQSDKALKCFQEAAKLYDESESDFMFSVEKRIRLKCLTEYSSLLKESGKAKDAEKLSTKIKELSEDLGPVEQFRQRTSEI